MMRFPEANLRPSQGQTKDRIRSKTRQCLFRSDCRTPGRNRAVLSCGKPVSQRQHHEMDSCESRFKTGGKIAAKAEAPVIGRITQHEDGIRPLAPGLRVSRLYQRRADALLLLLRRHCKRRKRKSAKRRRHRRQQDVADHSPARDRNQRSPRHPPRATARPAALRRPGQRPGRSHRRCPQSRRPAGAGCPHQGPFTGDSRRFRYSCHRPGGRSRPHRRCLNCRCLAPASRPAPVRDRRLRADPHRRAKRDRQTASER